MSDKQKVIWSVCDEMQREGKERKEITGRKVAAHSDVEWSHTTVTPYVTAWHDRQTKAEQDALAKTQMSPHFVKALQKEVEERVSLLRKIDAEQMSVLASQLSDMVLENDNLESRLKNTKAELEDKSEKLAGVSSELETIKVVQNELRKELEEKTSQHESKLEKASIEYSAALSQLNAQHVQSIEKLNLRIEDKSKEISELNARLAHADIKVSGHEKLTQELSTAIATIDELKNDNITLNAELNATKINVETLKDTLSDTKFQRDKAQEAAEQDRCKLELEKSKREDIQMRLNDVLLETATQKS